MKFGAVLVLIIASVMFADSAQIKSNFEAGDFSGWNTQGEGWSIYKKAASNGKNSAMCVVKKGEAAGLKACARIVEKAEPGWVVTARLDVSGKAKSRSSKSSFALMCIDADGNTIREVKKQVVAPATEFKTIVLEELIVPSGTKEVYFMMVVEIAQTAKSKEWWRFDNVIIEVK
jgi:hypothetical protein